MLSRIVVKLLLLGNVLAIWDDYAYKRTPRIRHDGKVIRFGVLLPASNQYFVSIGKVQLLLQMAKQYVENHRTLLPGYKLEFEYRNTNCSSLFGPIEAFKLKDTVDVFLGPACDFSCSPVAGYTTIWGIPLVTGGALSELFGRNKEKEYALLTRTGPTLSTLSEAYYKILHANNFQKTFGIYDVHGQGDKVPRFCYFATDAINHYNLVHHKGEGIGLNMFVNIDDMDQVFRERIGLNYAGEYTTLSSAYLSICTRVTRVYKICLT